MNNRIKNKKRKQKNKKLVEKYPFLMPKDEWTNKPIKNYNYKWTLLDDMPRGWKKAFGELLAEDIMNELIANNALKDYSILQVKEKFGELRWYDYGGTRKINEIINNYSHISRFVCVDCGKINVPIIDDGWIQPMCKCCFNKHIVARRKYGIETSYEKVVSCEANLRPTYQLKVYSKDEGERIITHDCTDILKRMKYLK